MAQGKETMIRDNVKEDITVSDGLQLGRTSIDHSEVRHVEEEARHLRQENNKVSYKF